MSETATAQRSLDEAQALQMQGRWQEALDVLEREAGRQLTLGVAVNLGVCNLELGRFAAAERWLTLAACNRPADPGARLRLGLTHLGAGRLAQAELELRTALAFDPADPVPAYALGGLLLSVGRYAEGWPLLEARVRAAPDLVPAIAPSYPEWKGEPLAGKSILVWVEQGLGDQIQFARFVGPLKAMGASHVTLACRPALAHLFSTLDGADAILPVGENAIMEVGRHDYWSRYFSLPGRLGVTLETLPSAPYLSAPADRRAGRARRGGVGLMWRGSPTGGNARNKALPQPLAERLLAAGAVSLEPADTGAVDFADTAAVIEGLDLVVAIDTAVAHLAGAMGKPCWTLLPFLRVDWRWMHARSDSPWYPSLRLYRQTAPGDWAPVVDQVLKDLAAR